MRRPYDQVQRARKRARTTFCPLDPRSDPFDPQRTERVLLVPPIPFRAPHAVGAKRASDDQLCSRNAEERREHGRHVFPGISESAGRSDLRVAEDLQRKSRVYDRSLADHVRPRPAVIGAGDRIPPSSSPTGTLWGGVSTPEKPQAGILYPTNSRCLQSRRVYELHPVGRATAQLRVIIGGGKHGKP